MSSQKTLDKKTVQHVAKLARLNLTDDEIKTFGNQLSDVISYIDELDEVDTSGIEPTSQTTGLENVTRDDTLQPTSTLSAKEATSGTENVNNNYFVVPLTLEERTV